ncbi:MAG: hypothetical protein BVN35_07640 [Proteobacteria bacterium ST_bin11]|nr:MAG: hypothetical protein BVN35_07640 [Proteobacteria bacterium ST_bin11]
MANLRRGNINRWIYFGLLFSIWAYSGTAMAELLGSISDETAPVIKPLEPSTGKNDDRKIIYRVICSPEDQDLPDCDKPAMDDNNQTAILPMPDLPLDSEDLAEQSAQAELAKSADEDKPQKLPHKKPAKSGKTVKKTAAKKASGTKPHK